MAREIVFIDLEVGVDDQRVLDFGAVTDNSRILHTKSKADFSAYNAFICIFRYIYIYYIIIFFC